MPALPQLWRTAVDFPFRLQGSIGLMLSTLRPAGRMAFRETTTCTALLAHLIALLPARQVDETTADECLGAPFTVLPQNSV